MNLAELHLKRRRAIPVWFFPEILGLVSPCNLAGLRGEAQIGLVA
jgi:hypothetical protein